MKGEKDMKEKETIEITETISANKASEAKTSSGATQSKPNRAKTTKKKSAKKTTKKQTTKSAKERTTEKKKKPSDKATKIVESQTASSAKLIGTFLQEILNLQKMWFDISTKQTELTLKLISEYTGVRNDALSPLVDAIRKNAENFLELQKQWTEIFVKQLSEVSSDTSEGYVTTLRKNTEKFLEGISQMHNAWAEFVKKQSESFGETVKKRLPAETGLPKTVDMVDSLIKSVLETQKRWIETAAGIFSPRKQEK